MRAIECGVFRQAERTVYHYAGYECAAWSQDVQVEPGDYPVRCLLQDDRPYWFCVTLPGVIVAAYFPALYCGMRVGSYDPAKDERLNTPGSHHLQLYSYNVFSAMREAGSPWRIDLAKLPHIGFCECGTAAVTHSGITTRCADCGVKLSTMLRARANSRYRRLVALMNRVDGRNRVADWTVADYLEGEGWMSEHAGKEIRRALSLRHTGAL